MQRIAERIQARLNLRFFLPLLAVALASTWYGLFWSVEHFANLTGGLRFMDMQPWLTPASLFEQVRTYSTEARDFYLWWSVFDYAWPFLSFTAMCFITAWLFRFLADRWQPWFPRLVASAYLTVLMDWLENIGFSTLAVIQPDEPLWLAQLTLAFHAAKLFFNMVFNIGFWIVLGAAIVNGIRARAAN